MDWAYTPTPYDVLRILFDLVVAIVQAPSVVPEGQHMLSCLQTEESGQKISRNSLDSLGFPVASILILCDEGKSW